MFVSEGGHTSGSDSYRKREKAVCEVRWTDSW
jgi:hypothetical protein